MKFSLLKAIHNALVTLPNHPLTPETRMVIARAEAEVGPKVQEIEAEAVGIRDAAQRKLDEAAAKIQEECNQAIAALQDSEVEVTIPTLPEREFTRPEMANKEVMELLRPLMPYVKPAE